MRVTKLIGTSLLTGALLAGAASTATADWLLNPFVGVSFEGQGDSKPVVYGGTFGFMAGGSIGLEVDAGFAPDFFGGVEGLVETNLTTLMANVIVGGPDEAPGARLNLSGGLGLIRSRADLLDDLATLSERSFGVNVGAGVMAFFSDHIGIRLDGRYFRNMRDRARGDNFDLALGNFDFWRATVGATLRF